MTGLFVPKKLNLLENMVEIDYHLIVRKNP